MVCVILFMANRVTPAFWFCLDNSTLTQVTPVRYFFLCFIAYHCNTYVGPRLSAFVFLKAEPFLIYNDDAEVFPQGSAPFFLPAFKRKGAFKWDPAVCGPCCSRSAGPHTKGAHGLCLPLCGVKKNIMPAREARVLPNVVVWPWRSAGTACLRPHGQRDGTDGGVAHPLAHYAGALADGCLRCLGS